jgi:hypothetical protein
MQRTLLMSFQSAVRLQEECLRGATSLAKALGCTREEARKCICELAITADTGMDLNERDLQMLLRATEAKGRIRVERPLES